MYRIARNFRVGLLPTKSTKISRYMINYAVFITTTKERAINLSILIDVDIGLCGRLESVMNVIILLLVTVSVLIIEPASVRTPMYYQSIFCTLFLEK